MKNIVLSAIIFGSILNASSDLDYNKINEKLMVFNTKHQFNMKVIDSTKISSDLYFVVVGDVNQSKFMNIVISKNADVAISPAQIVPLKEGEEWDSYKSNLENMVQKISNETKTSETSSENLLKPLSIAMDSIDHKNVFYFNGAESMTEYPVYIVDPLCPNCQDEVLGQLMKDNGKKIPFAILPVAGFGDRSIDSVVYLVANANKDFKSFAKTFAEAKEKTAVNEEVKSMIYKSSEIIFSTGLVEGIPLRFDYKKAKNQ